MSDELVDLGPAAGVAVHLNTLSGKLRFRADVTGDPPGERALSELRAVLRDSAAHGLDPVYRLYRGVRYEGDELAFAEAGLRYDVTVTLPGKLGREYAKTAGHYHPAGPEGASLPEVYEVVHGRGAFVLQHVQNGSAEDPRVSDVWVQVCDVGDRIIIPPDCGHVTVNVGPQPLVVADLISSRCRHEYGSFRARRGAAYYVLADAAAKCGFRLERNRAYGVVPEAVVGVGPRWDHAIDSRSAVYTQFQTQPGDFAFLTRRPSEVAARLLDLWRR